MSTMAKVPIYTQLTAKKRDHREEGWLVGVISRKPIESTNDFNPLTIYWTVNKLRKDYPETARQHRRKGNLSRYSQSLFDNCFRNW